MMRKLILAAIALTTAAIVSCSDNTSTLGNTLTIEADQYDVLTDTFDVATRSIKLDSVLSNSVYSYLGRLKDPETGSYITSDYMTQFNILDNQASKLFPDVDEMIEKGAEFPGYADSCYVSIVINSYQGDSLAAMKLRMMELGKPVEEGVIYYTNFDPEKKGYIRQDDYAIEQDYVYSMVDLTNSDSLRNVYRTKGYYESIDVPLNKTYIDKDGNSYMNYGTYIMETYYKHPEYFKNSQTFIRKVCPGFYFKCIDGLGVMSEVAYTQLRVFYHYSIGDVIYSVSRNFNGTEEVLQTTHITNDKTRIDPLVEDDECTYLKTPAGICTEVTLPVEKIKMGHESDSLTSARIVFSRMTEKNDFSDYVLEEPTNLLMVPSDSLYSFFERNGMPNNKTSYLATFNSTYKTYTFNNLSALINHMWAQRNKTPNWNKVILIPVQVETTGSSTTTTTVATVSNEMNINSVRLVGGKANKHQPVRISIIYNRGYD
jgi:hypothetical protein